MKLLKNLKWGGVIQLAQICEYQINRIDYSSIDPANYISTENMLQDCEGRTYYEGSPEVNTVIEYRKGDILVSNIRPYLQKIWLADCDGGCNPDVLVIRVKDSMRYSSEFVYYALRRKVFFDHMMQNKSGIKMPRGNKINNLRFETPNLTIGEQQQVLHKVCAMEKIIREASDVMKSCESRKQEIINKSIFNN